MRGMRLCSSFAVLFVFAGPIATSHADRLIFQRGDAVYLSALDGGAARKRATLSDGDGGWAAARDGRRIAWVKRVPGPADAGMTSRPTAIYVADTAGRREKKLVTTTTLKDRSDRRVTEIAPTRTDGGVTRLDDWTPLSLGFSADGRTIYLGIARTGNTEVELATVAVDAYSGAAVVDGDGRWKVLAPVAQADARDDFFCGVGSANTGAASDGAFAPLTVVRFADESIASLPPTAVSGGKKPAYGSALLPAISPDSKRIAFSALPGGIWVSDPLGKFVKRVIATDGTRPRWSTDGTTLYFLAPRPSTGTRPSLDLYSLPAGTLTGSPKKVADDLDWFDVIPD